MSAEDQDLPQSLTPCKPARRDWPRTIAVVLSVGGTLWAIFLLIAFVRFGLSALPQVFAVGFLLYIGWLMRALGGMRPLPLRRAFWCGSFTYHALLSTMMATSGADEPVLPSTWWALVALLSLLALFTERRTQTRP